MNNRERMKRVLDFEPVDRLPVIEWAGWWDKTLERWYSEGLPRKMDDRRELYEYLGLDLHFQDWVSPRGPGLPQPASHGAPIIADRDDYLRLKEHLYPETAFNKDEVREWAALQEGGDAAVWLTLEGFFWFPRTLLGIEPHLYAFYDQPDLMHEINRDLLRFNMRVFEEFREICVPDFVTFAEDMSYNHGPMLSREQFDEFLAPYYRQICPLVVEKGSVAMLDTDGNVEKPVDWYTHVGIQGFLPLERMAGVDVCELRLRHPDLRMIGAFDKTVMHLGEQRVRQEFERLLPIMRQGGFIIGVDHQTPPEVSLEDYKQYVRLLKEYCIAAAGG